MGYRFDRIEGARRGNGYIDVGDGRWRRNALIATIRCW